MYIPSASSWVARELLALVQIANRKTEGGVLSMRLHRPPFLVHYQHKHDLGHENIFMVGTLMLCNPIPDWLVCIFQCLHAVDGTKEEVSIYT